MKTETCIVCAIKEKEEAKRAAAEEKKNEELEMKQKEKNQYKESPAKKRVKPRHEVKDPSMQRVDISMVWIFFCPLLGMRLD